MPPAPVWDAALGVEDHFVGRRDELGVLESSLEDVRAARPRVVLVHGPAGVGKSALLRRFLGRLEGTRVLQASGDETEQASPSGCWANSSPASRSLWRPPWRRWRQDGRRPPIH